MQLEIITPDKNLYKGVVDSAVFPGKDGSFGILENHAPLIATLKKGVVKIMQKEGGNNHFNSETGKLEHSMKDDKELSFEINGGVVEVLKNKVIVLAD